ncbi:zinc finger protein 76-like [Acanthaster planci]|uniref:Zinc finger protein 76-like n=1 Tax=Acanthaster planci TaxID=133434 RepID=A0A8B7XSF9_ACAPL|nr:zinc finger protein 76-like [Acanthaster planci]XP_022082884.1 zinc finger protein 76-like [Acanthaster planci]XP_022082886.1 zinc finger protein 76-like [Acanthaster planci]
MEIEDQPITEVAAVPVVSMASGNDQEVIGMLLAQQAENEEGDLEIEQPSTSEAESSVLPTGTITSTVGDANTLSFGDGQSLHVQAVQFSDGSTAIIQQKDLVDGQTVQLADGSTAYIQQIPSPEKTSSFEDGQAVQLEDGSTAYILRTQPKGQNLQAVQLEDGTTAFIQTQMPEGFPDQSQGFSSTDDAVDPSTLNVLDQFTNQQIETDACSSQDQLPKVRKPGLMSNTKTYNLVNSGMVEGSCSKGYRCRYNGCGRMYTTAHHLKVHERSHSGEKPYKCEVQGCGKAFASGYGLKSHTRVHTGEKPYRCPEEMCTRAFKTSGDLQKHVRTHTGERPFKCPFEGCDKCFTTSNIRKVHIRTHTGERPYICDEPQCGRAFASATNYKNHMRIHTGEKPYVCTVAGCGKRFTEYSSLYKHHVVHTHSKPYICCHCGKNYRQTSTLAMHKRTAHGDVEDGEEMEDQAQFFTTHTVADAGPEIVGGPVPTSISKRPTVQYDIPTVTSEGATLSTDNIVIHASGTSLLQQAAAANVSMSQISDIVGSSSQVTMVTSVDPEVAMAAIKAAAEETALQVVTGDAQGLTEDQRQQLQDAIVAVNVQETPEGVSMENVVTAVETDTAMASLES